ncbi:hypothetical protein PHET_10794 [Paragonimus heterotremus]|uniref:Endoplasmic reticulum vesicle transporter C-terminal domain-containing protein n=1 Tax=Paragonimus heterotremus TaxID=100268 RepID=A0A8J4T1L9_9TREM|nr:hypothetical protein PHET_10794 [Paragonimus heterotremus]
MLWKRDHLLRSESLFGTTSAGSDDGLVPTGRLEKYDACHIVGTLFVRKVAGNMHLIPGKAITGPGGMHLHISPFLDLTAYNFSHRINHLSFGVHIANRVGPLDAVEEVALSRECTVMSASCCDVSFVDVIPLNLRIVPLTWCVLHFPARFDLDARLVVHSMINC